MKKIKLPAEEKTIKNAENAKKISEKVSRGETLNFSERNIQKIIDKKSKKEKK
jgi:hypothetical protein